MEREPAYEDLHEDALHTLLDIHRKNLDILEQQAATFTILHVPPHIVHSIESESKKIDVIKLKLENRGIHAQSDVVSITSIIHPLIDKINTNVLNLEKIRRAQWYFFVGATGVIFLVLSLLVFVWNLNDNDRTSAMAYLLDTCYNPPYPGSNYPAPVDPVTYNMNRLDTPSLLLLILSTLLMIYGYYRLRTVGRNL
jgi:hypothetical protein